MHADDGIEQQLQFVFLLVNEVEECEPGIVERPQTLEARLIQGAELGLELFHVSPGLLVFQAQIGEELAILFLEPGPEFDAVPGPILVVADDDMVESGQGFAKQDGLGEGAAQEGRFAERVGGEGDPGLVKAVDNAAAAFVVGGYDHWLVLLISFPDGRGSSNEPRPSGSVSSGANEPRPSGSVSSGQRLHGVPLFVENVVDRRRQISFLVNVAGAAVAGPALAIGIVESRAVQRLTGISLEVVHHPLGGLGSGDDDMNVLGADMNRMQRPTAMFAHAANEGQHQTSTVGVHHIGRLAHVLPPRGFDFRVRRQPGRIHGVVLWNKLKNRSVPWSHWP